MVRSVAARARLALAFWMLLAIFGVGSVGDRASNRAFALGARQQS
jgi:hypothetical protein